MHEQTHQYGILNLLLLKECRTLTVLQDSSGSYFDQNQMVYEGARYSALDTA